MESPSDSGSESTEAKFALLLDLMEVHIKQPHLLLREALKVKGKGSVKVLHLYHMIKLQ